MIPFISFFLLLVGAQCAVRSEMSNDVLKNDLETVLALETFLGLMNRQGLHRMRRDPQGEAKIVCGRKLIPRVASVCDGPCTPGTNTNIATTCCHMKCTDDYIKEVCCPKKSGRV